MTVAPSEAIKSLTSLELFNLLQAQHNWPSGGSPAVFDLRESSKRIIRGSHRARLAPDDEVEVAGASSRSWRGRDVCLIDATPDGLTDHPVARALVKSGACRELYALAEPFGDFEQRYPFLCAKESSSKAGKRSLYPSCILPGLLYLGDLSDAAALPRLKEQLNIQAAVTALAELPPSLQQAVADAKVRHTWCNVRDVEEANIKAHFAAAYEQIEACREKGTAIFVHCSRGVSRSASLCMAYLMRKESMSAADARRHVEQCRPIVLPNPGFWRCLTEYEKELSGKRSGVYAPAPKAQSLDDLDFELPPEWAAPPTHTKAALRVTKGGELVETFPVGEHDMYTFGRSLTCDCPLDHPSISRNHACLVHHLNGGVYVIDLKSSHGTQLSGKALPPYQATLLKEGVPLTFGASSRTYTLEGAPAPAAPVRAEDEEGAGASSSASAGVAAGPMLPGEERKRKYTPADAKAKKRQRWLNGPKASSKMSENERVARSAGSGSGCFGPGFD